MGYIQVISVASPQNMSIEEREVLAKKWEPFLLFQLVVVIDSKEEDIIAAAID